LKVLGSIFQGIHFLVFLHPKGFYRFSKLMIEQVIALDFSP